MFGVSMTKALKKLYVGPAGIPLSAKKRSTPEGIKEVASLGLDAMEIEFVRGVKMSDELALKTREAAEEEKVKLTVHAPYYINLLSNDETKVKASIERILASARVGYKAGAWSVVFHPGYYGKLNSEEGIKKVRVSLKNILRTLRDEGVDIWVRPETMGGLAEFGSLEEVLKVVEGLENASITIDFAHLYARSLGKFNNYREFSKALELIEKYLGKEALKSMHIHISGMEYGQRGEKRHLPLQESDFNWEEVIKALIDYRVAGVIICESPILEKDALLIKEKIYSFLRKK